MSRRPHGNNRQTPQAQEERREMFQKTKMCKFFIVGACSQGENCRFAHNDSELSSTPDLNSTKICKTLLKKGFCKDPNCTYAHSREELRVVPGFNDDRISFAKISKSLQAAEAIKQKAFAKNADSSLRQARPAKPGDVAKEGQPKKKPQGQKPPQPMHHPQAPDSVAGKPCPAAVETPAFYPYTGNMAAMGSSWTMPDGYFDVNGGAMSSHAGMVPDASAQVMPRPSWYYSNASFCDSDYSNDQFGGEGFSDALRSEPWRVDAFEQDNACLEQETLSKANLRMFCNSSGGGDGKTYDGSEAAKMPSMEGTKVCKSLRTRGVCKDPQCKFAHSKEELRFIPGVNDDSASLAKIYKALAVAESMSAKFQSAEASSQSSKGKGHGKEAKESQAPRLAQQARQSQSPEAHLRKPAGSGEPGAAFNPYLASGSNNTSPQGEPWPPGPGHFEVNDDAISGAERAGWYYSNASFCDSDYSGNHRISSEPWKIGAPNQDHGALLLDQDAGSERRSSGRGATLASTLSRFGFGSRASSCASIHRNIDPDGPDDGYCRDVPLSPAAAHRLDTLGGFTINERRIASKDSGSAELSMSDKAPPAVQQQHEPVRIEASSLKSLSIHSRSVPPSVAMSEEGDKLSPRVAKILDDPLHGGQLPVSLSVKNTFLNIDDPQPEEKIRKTLSEGRLGVLGAYLRSESPSHDLGAASGAASLLAKSPLAYGGPSSMTRSRLGMQSRLNAFSNCLDLVPEDKRIFGRQQSVESGKSEFSNWNQAWQRQCTTESMASQADPIPEVPQAMDGGG